MGVIKPKRPNTDLPTSKDLLEPSISSINTCRATPNMLAKFRCDCPVIINTEIITGQPGTESYIAHVQVMLNLSCHPYCVCCSFYEERGRGKKGEKENTALNAMVQFGLYPQIVTKP